jgi:hypothetical protein
MKCKEAEYSIMVMLAVVSTTYLSVWQEFHRKVDSVDYQHWKEPKLIVKILLHFFCHHPNDIDLLFQLLRALCERFIPDFQVCIRMI